MHVFKVLSFHKVKPFFNIKIGKREVVYLASLFLNILSLLWVFQQHFGFYFFVYHQIPRHLFKLPQVRAFYETSPGSAGAAIPSPRGHPIAPIIAVNASSEPSRMGLAEDADGWGCGQEGNTCCRCLAPGQPAGCSGSREGQWQEVVDQ